MIRTLSITVGVLGAVGEPGVAQTRAPTAAATAFLDVSVVPMDREQVLTHHTVVVQGDRIVALGPTEKVAVPARATRIDGRGKFLMPGLGDCYTQMGAKGGPEHNLPPDSVAAFRLLRWLADGVTTIRNLEYYGGDEALQLRTRAAAGKLRGPRLYTAGAWGPAHYTNQSAVTNGAAKKPNLDSVPFYVAAYKTAGYDVLGLYQETPEVAEAVFAAARQVGLPVAGRLTSLRTALAGVQSIERMAGYPDDRYAISDSAPVFAQETKQAGVWNCVAIQTAGQDYFKTISALHDVGAGLLLGSTYPGGHGVHLELELLVQAGLTPYEALATGTKNFAEYLKTIDETGTIAVGKRADLVLLEDNPLQNISNVRRRVGVMRGGRWWQSEDLVAELLRAPWAWFRAEFNHTGIAHNVTTERAQQLELQLGKIKAASDSLSAVAPKSPDYERRVQGVAQEIGALRDMLESDQYPAFDPMARIWLRVQTRRGYKVDIPGVAP